MGIDWVLELLDEERKKKRRTKGVLSPKKIPTDKAIKFCPNCHLCWEIVWYDGIKKINHYNDFPKLGKEEESCGCLNNVRNPKSEIRNKF